MRLTLPAIFALALIAQQHQSFVFAEETAAAEAAVATETVEAAEKCDGAEETCANPDAPAAADEESEDKEPEDPACPSRPHIIRCAAAHLDVNKNNKLEREELQGAIDSLPFLARGVLKIIGSVDKIMAKCDADGDGAISIDHDMDATKETCLATCFKRKSFKRAFFPDCEL